MSDHRIVEAGNVVIQPNFSLLLLPGVQFVRYGSTAVVTRFPKSTITHLRLEVAISICRHRRGVHLILQKPGNHTVLAHGNHCAIEAVVLARVGVGAIRLHLVGGAGGIGGDVVDHGLHQIAHLAAFGVATTANGGGVYF